VLLGGSFIALEAAAALRDRGLDITIVAKEDQPLAKIFGPQLSKAICAVHEAHGNRFILGRTITATSEGEVMLDDGSRLACDVLLVGTGVKPAIELAVAAGLTADQGVVVDPYLATSAPDVFAAGDIAAWPDPHSDQRIRVEHWTVAERQGQVAARNMLGERQAFTDVPFFWTKHFDFAVRYLGHAAHWDEISLDGDLGTRDCTIHYLEKGRRAAAAFVGRDAACLAWREAMERSRAACLTASSKSQQSA
jgi:NADPH-dependent 2,4-dienoyl-CoA reductase/sulfur reductase-like enzyme